jgi:hypothetical protein
VVPAKVSEYVLVGWLPPSTGILAVMDLSSFSRIMHEERMKMAPGSSSDLLISRSDLYVSKHFTSSFMTAVKICSDEKIDLALNKENSLRCRGGGEGRISVARLFSSAGGGFASRCCLSRMDAA